MVEYDEIEAEEIMEEAYRYFRRWNHMPGARGQLIMPQDGIEYWIIMSCKNRWANKDGQAS